MTEEETKRLDEAHAGKTEERKPPTEPTHIGSSDEAFRKAEEERVRRLNTPSKGFTALATGGGRTTRHTFVSRGAAPTDEERRSAARLQAKRASAEAAELRRKHEREAAETELLTESAKLAREQRKKLRRRGLSGAFATRPEEPSARPVRTPKRRRRHKPGRGKVVVRGERLSVRNFDEKRGERRARRLTR